MRSYLFLVVFAVSDAVFVVKCAETQKKKLCIVYSLFETRISSYSKIKSHTVSKRTRTKMHIN